MGSITRLSDGILLRPLSETERMNLEPSTIHHAKIDEDGHIYEDNQITDRHDLIVTLDGQMLGACLEVNVPEQWARVYLTVEQGVMQRVVRGKIEVFRQVSA